MTPRQVSSLTPAEAIVMLDGLDWVADRAWERALFTRLEGKTARDYLELNYPHFRAGANRVVRTVSSGPRTKPSQKRLARHG